jgi:hypothetical protein
LFLNKALEESEELRNEKSTIEALRERVKQSVVNSFSSGFTERVMKHVFDNHHEEEILFDTLVRIFKPVVVAAVVLLVCLIFYNISETNQMSFEGAYAITDVSVEEAFDPLVDLTTE